MDNNMDNEHTSQDNELAIGETGGIPQAFSTYLSGPVNVLFSITSGAVSILRPFAPQIIPVLICLILIPLSILLSFSAGFIVWQNVAAGWESPLHLQFGDGVPPYAFASLSSLVPQQRYDVSVHLTIPTTESNVALGNFMTTLTLSTPSNKTLTSVRRPAIVFPPRASFLRRTPSSLTVTVPMLASFLPGSSQLVAYVEIGRRDGWRSLGTGEGREISVISASVQGVVIHHGIRGLVSRFPLTFALLSATVFLVTLSFILASCILPTILRATSPEGVESLICESRGKALPRSPPSSSSSESDEQPRTRRRRAKLSRSSSGKSIQRIKVEAPITTIPSASSTQDLRRRVSRALDGLSDSGS